jgi:hypothetical protein
MTRVISTRLGPGLNFDTTYADNVPEVRVDGFGDVMLSPAGLKVLCYQVRFQDQETLSLPVHERVEQRQAALVLSMPVAQLVQGMLSVLSGIAANIPAVMDASKAELAQVQNLLEKLDFSGVTPMHVPAQSKK